MWVSIPPTAWARPISDQQDYNATSFVVLDAAGEKATFYWQAEKSGSLYTVDFYLSGVTTPQPLKVSFQDLNANGEPDGAIDQYRAVTVTTYGRYTTGLVTSDGTDGGTKRTVVVGQIVAIVFEWNASAGNLQIGTALGAGFETAVPGIVAFYNGSAWDKNGYKAHMPVVAVKYADGAYGYAETTLPWVTVPYGATSFSQSTSPDEVGNRNIFPYDVKIGGIVAQLSAGVANADVDLVLYDQNSVALATVQAKAFVPAATQGFRVHGRFSAAIEVLKNTICRVAAKGAGSGSAGLGYRQTPIETMTGGAVPQGATMYYTSRTDSGAWTDSPGSRAQIWPLIEAIDIVTGGVGLVNVAQPVSADGLTLTLVKGDDYLNAIGRALVWQSAEWEPDLTGATVRLTVSGHWPVTDITVTGTVVASGGAGVTQTVRFDMTAAQTSGLVVGCAQTFDIESTISGYKVTLVVGTCVPVRGYTP